MNEQLLLENIRGVLMRLEETIVFAVIERAQFRQNLKIYEPAVFGAFLEGESLTGYLLRETERAHARLRRYTSPDEHPFFPGLPEPLLPAMRFDESPLVPNTVNLNAALRLAYEREMVPYFCVPGDDGQYGSSAMDDVAVLQALSRRVHYGKLVAESKFRAHPDDFRPAMAARDAGRLLELITVPDVEERVLRRVALKARTYGRDPEGQAGQDKIDPEHVVELFRRWLMPMTKQVEVDYLLQRRPEV